MDYFQKLILLVLVSSTTCSSNSARRLTQQYKAINLTSPDQSDCFCFEKSPSSISVPNVLQISGHELERLVVYFYRDTVTKEIKAFKPSLEKQRLIPDLSSDTNDVILTVSTETVYHIFMNSPWLKLHKQLNSSTQIKTYETKVLLTPLDNDNSNLNIQYVLPNNNQDYAASYVSQNTHDIYSPGFDIDNLTPMQYEGAEPNMSYNVHEDEELGPCSQYDPANPVADTESCGDNLLSLYASGDATVTDTKLTDNDKDHNNFYITFDKWLDDQMKQVEMKPTEIKGIDIVELKRRIEVALKENGMFVSSYGVVDQNGHILNMANLKLRPIYIGDSVNFGNLTNGKPNIKLQLPVNLQYLESILVTLIEPSRILGIIPFRKVFLPTQFIKMQWNDHNVTQEGNKLTVGFPKQAMNSTRRHVAKPIQNILQPQFSKYFQPFNMISKSNIPENEKITNHLDHKEDDNIKSDAEHRWNRLFATTDTDKNGQNNLKDSIKEPEVLADKLKGMLNTLLELSKAKEIKGEDDEREKESEIEEPDLGFRIIGGNAATSSGYPLQYKGRSGLIE